MTGPTSDGDHPVRTVDDLVLTPLDLADVDDFARLTPGDTQLRRWSSLSHIADRASAEAWVRSRTSPTRREWAIRDSSGRLVGRVALHDLDLDEGTGEIGYGLFAASRGRGIARRVVDDVTTFGFEVLRLRRIELLHAVDNHPSCRVAHACGYALEGTKRQALDDHRGGWDDAHLHARLSTDPAPAGPGAKPQGG